MRLTWVMLNVPWGTSSGFLILAFIVHQEILNLLASLIQNGSMMLVIISLPLSFFLSFGYIIWLTRSNFCHIHFFNSLLKPKWSLGCHLICIMFSYLKGVYKKCPLIFHSMVWIMLKVLDFTTILYSDM